MKTNKLLTASLIFFLLIACSYGFFLIPNIAAQDSTSPSSQLPPQPVALIKNGDNPAISMPAWVKDPSLLLVNDTWYAAVTYRDPQSGFRFVRMFNSTDFFSWQDMGIIISPAADWEGNVVAAPALYYDNDSGTYYCFYQGDVVGTGGIGYASTSNIADPSSWVKNSDPVITPTLGEWDSAQTYDPDITKVGNTYYLYYIGSTQNTAVVNRQLGLATSSSITGPYTKYSGNPIFSNNDSCWMGNQMGIEGWEVFRHNKVEYAQSVMWAASGNCAGSQEIALYYATNESMLNWAVLNESFITPSQNWESNAIGSVDSGTGHAGFYVHGDELHILYQGKSANDWAIGAATAQFQDSSSITTNDSTPTPSPSATATPAPTDTPAPSQTSIPLSSSPSFPTLNEIPQATQPPSTINHSPKALPNPNQTSSSSQNFVETIQIISAPSSPPSELQLSLPQASKLQQITLSKPNYLLCVITGSITLAAITLLQIKKRS